MAYQPVSYPGRVSVPRKFGVAEWFSTQSFKIPRDVVREAKLITPGPNSRVGSFFAFATMGNGLKVPFSFERPLLDRQIEAMGGIDSDMVITQPNWFVSNYGIAIPLAGTNINFRQLFQAEVVVYPEMPDFSVDKRVPVMDTMVPFAGTNLSGAYNYSAMIPCHMAKSVSLSIFNGTGTPLSWYVVGETHCVHNELSLGTPLDGAVPVVTSYIVDPYTVGGSSTVAPPVVNTLPDQYSDTRQYTNLGGQYLFVLTRVGTGTPPLSGVKINWEVRD